MNSRTLISTSTIALFTLLAMSTQLFAQQHHHYKLVDLGTFGGPLSGINEPLNYVPAVNGQGQTVGFSANGVPDSATNNPAACFGTNVTHAFEWKNGAVTDLGSLAGANFCSDADSINEQGEIEGLSEIDAVDPVLGFNEMRAVVWRRGQIANLGTLGGSHSWSFGINNRGQVVGLALNAVPDPYSIFDFVIFGSPGGTQTRAFLWQNGVMHDLGTLGGPDAWAGGINERGQIAGQSYTSFTPNLSTGFPTLDPFFWDQGRMQDLGSLGGVVGFVEEMNSRGQVIGGSSTAANPTACYLVPNQSIEFGNPGCDPFFWEGGAILDLATNTVGAIPQTSDAINDLGEIVGAATFPDQPYDAYLRTNGKATDLGHLAGDCASEAWAINFDTQVVGDSFSCGLTFQHAAFLWENGAIVDLNSLIPAGSSLQLVFANAINDRGEIAGNGVPPGISPGDVFTLGHAFLLIPCDENHPDVEGCDYSLVEEAATAAEESQSSTKLLLSPQENVTSVLPNRLSLWHHRFGAQLQGRPSSSPLGGKLSAPQKLAASAINTYQIRLNWEQGSGQNPSGFNIYRCNGCSSPQTEGMRIASVGATVLSYMDGSSAGPLTESETYTYQVTAVSANGESGPSNISSASTETELAPTNLTSFAFVRGGFDDVVRLSWTNNSSDDDSYFVESCSGATCTNFSVVAQLPANDTSDFQGYQFIHNVTVRYRVRTHSPGGFSGYSNIRNQLLP